MTRRKATPAFTLIELVVVISIMAILMSIVTLTFRYATDGAIIAQARNTLVTYARMARSYAIANQIETMMVVNPYNGRLELWHANPPATGGPWDPQSAGTPLFPGGTAVKDPRVDGYAFAPVFDSGARLPVSGDGRPRIAVHPLDFGVYRNGAFEQLRPTDSNPEGQYMDNLTWSALCFSPSGRLAVVTRRVATRSFMMRDGVTVRPNRNRLLDESPNVAILTDQSVMPGDRILVAGQDSGGNSLDTAITSTTGFVLSDAEQMRRFLGTVTPTPSELVNVWLKETIPNPTISNEPSARMADFTDIVVINRFSGEELGGL